MDLSFQGQQAFEMLNKLESEKANFEAQRKYYYYLRDYLAAMRVLRICWPLHP